MINGTHDRLKNLSKLLYVLKSLQVTQEHTLVLAIKGNNFEDDNFKYHFLLDHTGKFQFNNHFLSSSCVGQLTREQVYNLVCACPSEKIPLFSPIKMIAALTTTKVELEKTLKCKEELGENLATTKVELEEKMVELEKTKVDLEKMKVALADSRKRCEALDDNLQKAQKNLASATTNYDNTVKKMQEEKDEIILQADNHDLNIQRRMGELLDLFFDREEGNAPKGNNRGWHAISWLPFAGSKILLHFSLDFVIIPSRGQP
jgi:hypothetical protein